MASMLPGFVALAQLATHQTSLQSNLLQNSLTSPRAYIGEVCEGGSFGRVREGWFAHHRSPGRHASKSRIQASRLGIHSLVV
eukprot:CAMPEP_0203883092 /NCGR_PEP_ID=MMETSP0359-20131031/27214_1 /ASSEMBLY_ACC=CAM_ASM_000338 /TAXON_ID=268821 /ORGANISM="Scrippsiella Hangoei, Strain SHTV-5" /LENGTH=81 /DNA_ID=CAMNT_0050803223 /DNA_START=32 /DNA_END=274 /DNA_ORIENTATION=+